MGRSFTERFLLFIGKSNTNSQGLAQLRVMSSVGSLVVFFVGLVLFLFILLITKY